MTDIKKQALALVNEVRAERRDPPMVGLSRDCFASQEALCRAIEQHEAFKQEVSDAVEWAVTQPQEVARTRMKDFIIPKSKPDTLAKALESIGLPETDGWPEELRAALAARGLKIVEVGHE